jgi:hypothetical protein
MPRYAVSRAEAIKRLRHRWLAQTSVSPEIIPIFPLAHFLTESNIRAVRKFDLYAQYSQPNYHRPHDRNERMLLAWLADDTGGRQ